MTNGLVSRKSLGNKRMSCLYHFTTVLHPNEVYLCRDRLELQKHLRFFAVMTKLLGFSTFDYIHENDRKAIKCGYWARWRDEGRLVFLFLFPFQLLATANYDIINVTSTPPATAVLFLSTRNVLIKRQLSCWMNVFESRENSWKIQIKIASLSACLETFFFSNHSESNAN